MEKNQPQRHVRVELDEDRELHSVDPALILAACGGFKPPYTLGTQSYLMSQNIGHINNVQSVNFLFLVREHTDGGTFGQRVLSDPLAPLVFERIKSCCEELRNALNTYGELIRAEHKRYEAEKGKAPDAHL